MKKKKIAIALILILAITKSIVYAKYVYQFEETIIELARDSNPPICSVTYSVEEMTNKNVIVTITANKEVQQISGFVLSEDKKKLTKEISKNESEMVQIRDLSGNIAEVEYTVNNIDKQAPQIIGCEDEQTYPSPLLLEYEDNDEIKEIIVDRYTENLELTLHEIYSDSCFYQGIDRTDTTLTIEVSGHPQNTKKYKYYINNQLYTTTMDTNYTFTGLTKGTTYTIKAEAIDEAGNLLDTTEIQEKTSYYHTIESQKTNDQFIATLQQIDNSVEKIKYAVWNANDEKNIKWHEESISNGQAQIMCEPQYNGLYPLYAMHAYLYDKQGNVLDVIGFSIDFGTNYEAKDTQTSLNELSEAGNYQIILKDFAGNETIYFIKVE